MGTQRTQLQLPADQYRKVVDAAPCFRCGALIGRRCMKPDGSAVKKPHEHRIRAFQAQSFRVGRKEK